MIDKIGLNVTMISIKLRLYINEVAFMKFH